MSKANTWEDGVLKLLFQNLAFAAVGDASGLQPSAAAGSLYISLHTSDPGEGGSQTTNETSYTGYARKAVARGTGEWSVASGVASLVNAQIFNQCTAGPVTLTHFGIGTDVSGAGKLLYSAALTAPFALTVGVSPRFIAGALTVSED
jgi:hypothetical protein